LEPKVRLSDRQIVGAHVFAVLDTVNNDVCATSSVPDNEFVSAAGVVIAIQAGKTDTRLIEPASFADLGEIYMVRVDRWSQPHKERYVLVEYIHHADLIRYDEFAKTRWNFEIRQASQEETRDCLSWMAREGAFHPTDSLWFLLEIRQASQEETRDCLSWMAREGAFHPTAFGAKMKLPDPKVLSCFLMDKRPSVVSESVPKLPTPG